MYEIKSLLNNVVAPMFARVTFLPTLAYNVAGLITIAIWAGFWGFGIFGSMKLLKMLRIDRETEFKGNDLIKHGESAYPRDAWVELQYSAKKSVAGMGITPGRGLGENVVSLPHMEGGNQDGENEKAYNDPNAMLPTFSKVMPFFRAHSNNAFEMGDLERANPETRPDTK